MFAWIASNAATIIISLLMAALVAGIIVLLRREKRKGKSTCGGSCGHCPMAGKCHSDK